MVHFSIKRQNARLGKKHKGKNTDKEKKYEPDLENEENKIDTFDAN